MFLIALAMLATATDEAVGDLFGGVLADLAGQACEGLAHCPRVERLVLLGPKIAGKSSGMSLPTMTLASVTVSGPPRR